MITFSYQARDMSGKIVSGIQDALNEDNAVTSLMSRGLMVLSLQQKSVASKVRKKTWTVKETDLVLFTRQLSTMIEAGISLVQALTALYDQCDPKRQKSLRHIISDVTTRVQGGETFHESIAKHPRVFDRLFVSMVKAGEHGGLLAEILDRLAGFLEASARLRKKVKSAMTYPTIVICIAMGDYDLPDRQGCSDLRRNFQGLRFRAARTYAIPHRRERLHARRVVLPHSRYRRRLFRYPHLPSLDSRKTALGQMEAQTSGLRAAHPQDLYVALCPHLCSAYP